MRRIPLPGRCLPRLEVLEDRTLLCAGGLCPQPSLAYDFHAHDAIVTPLERDAMPVVSLPLVGDAIRAANREFWQNVFSPGSWHHDHEETKFEPEFALIRPLVFYDSRYEEAPQVENAVLIDLVDDADEEPTGPTRSGGNDGSGGPGSGGSGGIPESVPNVSVTLKSGSPHEIVEQFGIPLGSSGGAGGAQQWFTFTMTAALPSGHIHTGQDVVLQLGGTATPGSDYKVFRMVVENGIVQEKEVVVNTNGKFSLPTSGGDSTDFKVIPVNDTFVENDETITLSIETKTASNSGGIWLGYTNVGKTQVVTIIDDDHWKVGVVATDGMATERLSDVPQDYGEYTITRTHAKSGVPGDTSYVIILNFDMLYDTICKNSPTNLAAQPISDYTLEYYKKTVITTSGGSSVSYDWAPLSYTSYTTIGTLTRYHYTVDIPTGDTNVKVRLLPIFDWEDEGVLFDPTVAGSGTPWDDVGENAWFEIRDNIVVTPSYLTTSATCGIWWSGLYSSESIAWDPFTPFQKLAKVEIKDGAVCLLTTDSNNDGVITMDDRIPGIKNPVNAPGRVLRVNTDDDDKNGVLDKWQRPDQFNTPMNPAALAGTAPSVTVQNEDDLAEVILYAWIDPYGLNLHLIDVYAVFPNDLVMWTQPTKGSRLHRGEINLSTGRVTNDTKLATLSLGAYNNVFERTVYMEANAEVVGNVELHAKFVSGCNPAHPNGYDSAKMTGVVFDLGIDSNNDSLYASPEHSPLEELLENDAYALGKLILPGYEAITYTPLRLLLPKNLDPNDTTFEVSFVYETNPSGGVTIGTKDKNQPNNTIISSEVKYTLAQLNYSPVTGYITLYISGHNPIAGYQTKTQVDGQAAAPSKKITATLYVSGQEVARDKVKYLVASQNSFYYEYYHNESLRAALAADLIYGYAGSVRYGLRLLDDTELEKLGVPPTVRAELTRDDDPTGFKAGLYRDGVTGKFILAFAGTNDFMDVIEDIWQGFGNTLAQYEEAMRIAYALKDVESITETGISITGHSLGGGLAGAAYCVSGFKTYTFNAAGLHKNTLYKNNDPNQGERYPGSVAKYNTAASSGLVTAYYADFDPLSMLQGFPVIPGAIGTPHELYTGAGLQMAANALISLLAANPYVTFATISSNVLTLLDCHRMPAIYKGMLNGKNLY